MLSSIISAFRGISLHVKTDEAGLPIPTKRHDTSGNIWRRIVEGVKKPEVRFIVTLLVVSRIVLTAMCVFSRHALGYNHHEHFSSVPWLDVWGIWDSIWYLDIAKNGYSPALNTLYEGQANYGFFPLLPLLTRGVAIIVRDLFWPGLSLRTPHPLSGQFTCTKPWPKKVIMTRGCGRFFFFLPFRPRSSYRHSFLNHSSLR